jgi:hypothetical protein
MGKLLRRLGIAVAVIVLLVGGLLGWAYYASQQVPDFYRRALTEPPADQEKKSDSFLTEATELYNELRRQGRWEALFTAEEINCWLAVDLARNHAASLPPGISDPRVAFTEGGIILACRYETPSISTVLSLHVDAYLAEDNVLALRFRKARAGNLPLPMAEVLDNLSREAARHNIPVRWLQAKSDPVALISMPAPAKDQKLVYSVDTVRIGEKGIYVAGTSAPRTAQITEPSQHTPNR